MDNPIHLSLGRLYLRNLTASDNDQHRVPSFVDTNPMSHTFKSLKRIIDIEYNKCQCDIMIVIAEKPSKSQNRKSFMA
jgi:hypothetical protein